LVAPSISSLSLRRLLASWSIIDFLQREADFLLALRTAAGGQKDVYSHGCTRATVVRFRTRLTDPRERETLTRLFGVPMPELNQALTDAYGRLRTGHHGWDSPPARLLQESVEL
jgi:hypothetical protein